MALPTFANEAAFRDQLIKPLLSRLGYILVTHHHGSNEHGKDFYFADFDRFEHPRYYAVQVKLGNIGIGDAETGNLLDQVKACFDVQIRDRKGGDEQRICVVYVMASGSISDQARTRISGFCRSEQFGESVFFPRWGPSGNTGALLYLSRRLRSSWLATCAPKRIEVEHPAA